MFMITSFQQTWFYLRLMALASLILLSSCVSQRLSGNVPPISTALTTQVLNVTMTATRLPDKTPSPSASPTATPPLVNPADPFIVVIDTAFIREGPGVSFPVAEAGSAQAAYGSTLTFDSVIAGDVIAGNLWWGHLTSGLGFVSMTAVRPIDFVSAGEAATSPENGQYTVAVDGVFVREGPGLSFPVALGGLAQVSYLATLDVDAVAQGEPLAGNPWWGHLADGRGFVSLVALQAVALLPTVLPSAPAQPTAEPTATNKTPILGGLPQEGALVLKFLQPAPALTPPPPNPQAPRIVVEPSQGIGPTRYKISLINFPAGRTYSLNFYRWYDRWYDHNDGMDYREGCPVHISQDTTETTNSQGQADYYLQIYPGDFSGRYYVSVMVEVDKQQYYPTAVFFVEGLPIPPIPTPSTTITITPTITLTDTPTITPTTAITLTDTPTITPTTAITLMDTPTITPTTAITLMDTPTVTLTPTISVTLVATIGLPPSVTATPSVEMTKPVEVPTATPTPSLAVPGITALPTVTPVAHIEPTLPTAPTTLLSATPHTNVPASRGSTTYRIGPRPIPGERLTAILWSHTKRHAI